MEWSPESWEVKVKRPSGGPLVLVTTCAVSISYVQKTVCEVLFVKRALETYLYFDDDSEFLIYSIVLCAVCPLQRFVAPYGTW